MNGVSVSSLVRSFGRLEYLVAVRVDSIFPISLTPFYFLGFSQFFASLSHLIVSQRLCYIAVASRSLQSLRAFSIFVNFSHTENTRKFICFLDLQQN